MAGAIYDDDRPPIHAIVHEREDEMLNYLAIYIDPDTRFEVTTGSGRCILTPLALAVEVPGDLFQIVVAVLVNHAHIDPSAPYVIDDMKRGVRIRTNALTHLIARWNHQKKPTQSYIVLKSLIAHGADARAPALYEVAPLWEHGMIPPYERALSSLSGQSLMAFLLSGTNREPPPISCMNVLIQQGHARFLSVDPDGLFVRYVLDRNIPDWYIDDVMGFLCPSEACYPIAGGLVARGDIARGELRRIVQSFDAQSGMNILHAVVALRENHDKGETMDLLRKLRVVYGLSLLTPTKDGHSVTELAQTADTIMFPQLTQAAVAEMLMEEQRLALAAAHALHHLPSLAVKEIGNESGLPILHARALYEQIKNARLPMRPFP